MPIQNKSYDELINRRRQTTIATYRAWNPDVNIKGQDASSYTEYVTGNRPYIVQTFGGERIEEPIILPSSGGSPGETEYVDAAGNIYTLGIYSSTTLSIYNADNSLFGTLTKGVSGSSMYVIKYNPSGTVLWATTINNGVNNTNSMCADKVGNVYICGDYNTESLSIYNANGTLYKTIINDSRATMSHDNGNVFIVKYSSSGVANWATQIGGILNEVKPLTVCDKNNNLYISCQYASSSLNIYNSDNTYQILSNSGNNDVALVKYNTFGFVSWATRVAGTLRDNISKICIDSNDNIYITGTYTSTILMIYNSNGTSSLSLTNSTGFTAGFIVKYNSSGVGVMATKLHNTTISIIIGSINIDNNDGSMYIVGNFSGTLTIYNADGNSTLSTLTNANMFNGYIVKYDINGIGVRGFIFNTSIDQLLINSANIDSNGDIYIVGNYSGVTTTTFRSSDNSTTKTITKTSTLGQTNGYIVKYNSNGILRWAINVDSTARSNVFGICVDRNNTIYISGVYSGTLTVKNAENAVSGISLAGLGSNDGFIIKYNADGVASLATCIGGNSTQQYITTPYFLGV